MAGDEFTMTPLRLAAAMSNRVLRERVRLGRQLVALCDANDLNGLRAFAEELTRSKPTVPTTLVEVEAPKDPAPLPDDGLPPVRHGDDFADGVQLALGQRQLATRLGRM